ncbi:hypothetical protein HBH56_201930 [Parastagonospora nodorum]|nr:hypothetical protein HBH56_201930 [Parastagonospora nodorum]KAH3925706.1 hypothetical protein HBH54_174360 [Parastagonospora nodorum]KAH3953026.1 hypothetical protein HBH53_035730 [Parastagonospora nodorum]KAH4036872.1 hypothetical protein HBI09_078490 [Parastagonospora nodorum]KAH4051723.1 hypothetical protein HBH49_107170 [Parastagonospora nodorum]
MAEVTSLQRQAGHTMSWSYAGHYPKYAHMHLRDESIPSCSAAERSLVEAMHPLPKSSLEMRQHMLRQYQTSHSSEQSWRFHSLLTKYEVKFLDTSIDIADAIYYRRYTSGTTCY